MGLRLVRMGVGCNRGNLVDLDDASPDGCGL